MSKKKDRYSVYTAIEEYLNLAKDLSELEYSIAEHAYELAVGLRRCNFKQLTPDCQKHLIMMAKAILKDSKAKTEKTSE